MAQGTAVESYNTTLPLQLPLPLPLRLPLPYPESDSPRSPHTPHLPVSVPPSLPARVCAQTTVQNFTDYLLLESSPFSDTAAFCQVELPGLPPAPSRTPYPSPTPPESSAYDVNVTMYSTEQHAEYGVMYNVQDAGSYDFVTIRSVTHPSHQHQYLNNLYVHLRQKNIIIILLFMWYIFLVARKFLFSYYIAIFYPPTLVPSYRTSVSCFACWYLLT